MINDPAEPLVGRAASATEYSNGSHSTRIIKGVEKVGAQILAFIQNAVADQGSSFVDVALDSQGPIIMPAYFAIASESMKANPKFTLRIIIDIQESNIRYVREMISGKRGPEIRHLEGNIRKFAYSGKEAIETSHSLKDGQPEEIIYSSDSEFVAEIRETFASLWARSVPAEERMKEIELVGKRISSTFVSEDSEEIIKKIAIACESSSKSLLFCTTQSSLKAGYSYLMGSYKVALQNHSDRLKTLNSSNIWPQSTAHKSPRGFQWIVQINDYSVAPMLEEFEDLGIELRHLDHTMLPFQFGIRDSEELFATFEASNNRDPDQVVSSVLFSNERAYITQFEAVFAELWEKAIPATERLHQIKDGTAPRRTEIVRGFENTIRASMGLYSRAEKTFSAASDSNAPSIATKVEPYKNAYLAMKKRGVKVRAITDIVERNASECKEILALGLVDELRHIENFRGNFAVSEKEYIAASTIQERKGAPELIYSNDLEMVSQNQYIFETLWSKAVPAEVRIRQIEEGIEPEETRLIQDMEEVYRISSTLIENCKEEILAILASERVLDRHSGIIAKLASVTAKRNLKLRILLSSSFSANNPNVASGEASRENEEHIEIEAGRVISKYLPGALWRRIEQPMNVTFFIFDHSAMFMTQYSDIEAETPRLAIFSNIYSTNRQTIGAVTNIFEALWRESELRNAAEVSEHREEKARRQAELLQDILSHDIRNYNQVAKLSAELIVDQEKDNPELKMIAEAMLKALDGSTELVEKTKKLGQILSQSDVKLSKVNLKKTIEDSIELIRKANSSREIAVEYGAEGDSMDIGEIPLVLADEFLGQVFLNLFSNSVKYNDGDEVKLRIILSRAKKEVLTQDTSKLEMPINGRTFWKVSIIDQGRGIPDNLKKNIFARYLEGAKGSGLGLSIVYALVRERYGGNVNVENRINNDYSKGTTFNIWLQSP